MGKLRVSPAGSEGVFQSSVWAERPDPHSRSPSLWAMETTLLLSRMDHPEGSDDFVGPGEEASSLDSNSGY